MTVWTGTQRPFGVKSELAQAFRIPEDHVRVMMPDMGSGYGGKHTGEVAIEAARLAKQTGKPVRVMWTREEEMTWAYFRPAGLIEVSSGVAADGTVTAWEFHNYLSGGSAIAPVYPFPNTKIEFHNVKSPLKPGSYRGLAATANHFAREVHMDELAAAVDRSGAETPLVIDVRQASEYEAGHLEGAWHIGAGELAGRLDELPRDRPIATICAAGYRASVAASLLDAAGFTNVSAVAGGVDAWEAQGLPLERGSQP